MKLLAGLGAAIVVGAVFVAAAVNAPLPRVATADAPSQTPGDTINVADAQPAFVAPSLSDPLPAIPVDSAPSFLQWFDQPLAEGGWYKADFVYRSPTQRAGWSKDHILQDGEKLSLKLTREPKEFQPYTGAELQRTKRYHYGRYQVVMRAAPGSGLVSSFFTHTDEYFGDPHNEIDFEFLGYDTAMVQLNFYTGNGNMKGHLVDLPYDAAEHFQLYTFDWLPDRIDWYIGDQHVFRATEASTGLKIPHRPSRLMMNLWSGSENQYDWHGRPTFGDVSMAHYLCASYQMPGDTEAPQCGDRFVADVPRLGEAPKVDAKH